MCEVEKLLESAARIISILVLAVLVCIAFII